MSPKYAGTRINNVLIADTISTNVESNMEDNNIPLNTELGRQVTTKPSKISWELWSGLSTNMAAAHNSMMYNMLNIMQSMQQTVLGLQNTVINLVAERRKPKIIHWIPLWWRFSSNIFLARAQHLGHQVSTIYHNQSMALWHPIRLHSNFYLQIPTGCIPHLNVVCDKQRKKIWERKDVNLAEL